MALHSRCTISAISRALSLTNSISNTHTPLFFRTLLQCTFSTSLSPPSSATAPLRASNFITIYRHFISTKKGIDTKVNFSLSDSDDSDDENSATATATPQPADKSKNLPPPYDPFSKKPAIEDPEDPKDLQEIFHNMRSGDGLFNHAVKMFDALSKEGLTHEALELFGQIKDKGQMPDVVAHTAVLEAYAGAGKSKEALKVFMRMLASGVSPNAYTYAVLIRVLVKDAKFLKDAKKYVLEMMDKGMRPNAETYTAVFKGLVREEKLDEAVQLLEQMKAKGFVPDEKAVGEVLADKRGSVFRNVMNILFGN
ncbi:pentatricopeptide repeat-containing protein At4g38150-like [Lotus japonicus]|uniref:pentatricopeptide repeat-containing protein At4g38150-like n=1 Tax=Lotus japonicus TaxID=34305 RepID=UPI0025911248|nr:pentatricopeptide repeat-containing protein At4g38150-like [Lotus japonicus]